MFNNKSQLLNAGSASEMRDRSSLKTFYLSKNFESKIFTGESTLEFIEIEVEKSDSGKVLLIKVASHKLD